MYPQGGGYGGQLPDYLQPPPSAIVAYPQGYQNNAALYGGNTAYNNFNVQQNYMNMQAQYNTNFNPNFNPNFPANYANVNQNYGVIPNPMLMNQYNQNYGMIQNPMLMNQYNQNYTPNLPHTFTPNPMLMNQNYTPNLPHTNPLSNSGNSIVDSNAQKGLERMKADAKTLLTKPGRNTRPPKIVIILRGLPGSGKSHYAKVIKDYETKNGGTSPRIFSIDDYFMVEFDKEEEDPETGLKRKVKGLEYKYEADMEEPYDASLLRAFRKCLTEGFFPFIIIDNINVRVPDFEQYCNAAKSAGYEVYILQMPPCDLKLLAQRNIHKRTFEEISKMSSDWQDTPYRYTVLSVESLENPEAAEITVVDMGEEDEEVKELPKEETKAASESKWAKLKVEGPPMKEKEKDKEKGKGKTKQHDLKSSVKAKTTEMQGLMSAYYVKKVRWADIETQKELERGFAVGGAAYKRKRYAHESDSDEDDNSNIPKARKESTFLEKVREEQEEFKVHLLARKALEQVKYIGSKENLGVLQEGEGEEDD